MVAIKNAIVPPSCYFCPMTNDGFYLCKANNPYRQLEDDCEERRPEWCPLVPVPPHGRLIDADALAEHKFVCILHVSIDGKDVGTAYRLGWNTAIEAVMENAETIMGGE